MQPSHPPRGNPNVFSFQKEWEHALNPPSTADKNQQDAFQFGASSRLGSGTSSSNTRAIESQHDFSFTNPSGPTWGFGQSTSADSSSINSQPVQFVAKPNTPQKNASNLPTSARFPKNIQTSPPVHQFGIQPNFEFTGIADSKSQSSSELFSRLFQIPPSLMLESSPNHGLGAPTQTSVLSREAGTNANSPALSMHSSIEKSQLSPLPRTSNALPELEAKVNVTSYDVRTESTPSHPFFSSMFQSQLQSGIAISRQAAKLFEDSSSWSKYPMLKKLIDDAKRLATFHASDTRSIAVLGDSGEGKSSLINSLLHFPGIAKTGDIGSACTSVVTEYRLKTPQHTAPITVEVEYLSKSEMEEVLSELLWSYRQLYLPGVESDETSAKDYERYTRESAQAWSALEAAFKHKRQFNENFLRDMSDGAMERVRAQLIEWSQEIEWPAGSADGIWKSTATTARECSEKTALFMSDRYWPFTKIIRVYLESRVLETGVVLADLPGLQDTNLARVRATQIYLMKCSNIFIVANISRAITDQSLKSSLYSVLSRHVPLEWEESAAKTLKIAVVCTKSEDIDLETARGEFVGRGKRIERSVVEKLDKDIKDAKDSQNRELKKLLKKRRELLFIEARNNHVKDGLRVAYSNKVPGRRLDVFCVSNKLYEKHSRKGSSEFVAASGIPDVRKFCFQITADAQLAEAKHFLQSSIFNLVNSLELCLSSITSSGANGVPGESRKLADNAIRATDAIRKLENDFMVCYNDQIMKLADNRHIAWERAAETEERRWETWHWTQFNAWCLNGGHHETGGRKREDWNAKIIWKMRSELEYQWDLVEEEIPELFEELLAKMRTLLVTLKDTIRGLAPPRFQNLLADGIDSRIRGLEYKLNLVKEEFTREVRLTRRFASESNSTSFILNQMMPAYRNASSQYGTGKAARQRAIISQRVTDGVLFPNMGIAISTRIEAIVKKIIRDLKSDIVSMIKSIETDVHSAFASSALTNNVGPGCLAVNQRLQKVKSFRQQVEIIKSAVDKL